MPNFTVKKVQLHFLLLFKQSVDESSQIMVFPVLMYRIYKHFVFTHIHRQNQKAVQLLGKQVFLNLKKCVKR